MLAGLAVVFTDTPGQRRLAIDLGEGAILYPPGDVAALAAGLTRWASDKDLLGRARAAAWQAARRRWHWEHREERGALLDARGGSAGQAGAMRIAITADPYHPVPPRFYGGIERVVDLLARRLVRRGHDVTLFAHPESRTDGRLIPYGSPPHVGVRHRLTESWQVGATLWRRRRGFDVIHSFGRLQALLPVLPLRQLPKVQSYQRAVPWRGVKTAVRLAGKSLCFTGCSASLYRDRPRHGVHGGCWRCVWNGVDTDKYDLVARVPGDAPLVFLGRLEPIKGAHHAIRIARAAGRRLVLAGNRVPTGPAAGYFEREIAGHIDGARIVYAGSVDDVQKNRLLGSAAALLMPVEWEEPFGLVMAEALACGTPVIGFAGAAFPKSSATESTATCARPWRTRSRPWGDWGGSTVRRCAADCEARFSGDAIAKGYEALYLEMVRR